MSGCRDFGGSRLLLYICLEEVDRIDEINLRGNCGGSALCLP